MSNEAFPFSTSQNINIGAVPVRAQRISYTGELGWEIFVDASFAPYLFELLMSGNNAQAPALIGFHAAESLRTEKAYRHWGHDIGYTDTPFESGYYSPASSINPVGLSDAKRYKIESPMVLIAYSYNFCLIAMSNLSITTNPSIWMVN